MDPRHPLMPELGGTGSPQPESAHPSPPRTPAKSLDAQTRFFSLMQGLHEKLDALASSQVTFQEDVLSRLDELESRLSDIETTLDETAEAVRELDADDLDGLRSTLQGIESTLDDVESTVNGIESTVSNIESNMDSF